MQYFLKSPGSRQGAIFQNHLPHREALVFVLLHLTAQGAQEAFQILLLQGREEAGVEAGVVTKADAFMLQGGPFLCPPSPVSVCSLHPYFHLNQGLCWVSA